ncbi:cis-prenyltransferase 4, chloroplastic-like [Henckelia pumila]|uniref:cis-prenyltransferase 4, chloroplastic-like n=1 Tax=Henckelia pumila TaxID=405737 RepID=UPI003C6DD066
MAAIHSLQIPKLSPNTRRPLFSQIDGTVANCLSHVHHHAEGDDDQLPPGLRRESMPTHVAVIMDGNRRWARMTSFPTESGYEAGFQAFKTLVDLCCKWRIRVLTAFVFSCDNWTRPKLETDMIMALLEKRLRQHLPQFMRQKIRISHIGDSTQIPKSLQVLLSEAAESTRNNSRLHLILAVNYSGQNDLVRACQNLALKVKDGVIEPKDMNKSLIEKELETNCTEFPNPDLLIRTSGELRISNFLLWQLAYTELYFANSLWPDFGEDEFVKALTSFQLRERRFGGKSS